MHIVHVSPLKNYTPVVALFSTPKLPKKVSKKGVIVEKRAKLPRKMGFSQNCPIFIFFHLTSHIHASKCFK